jgi:hypothetical protein
MSKPPKKSKRFEYNLESALGFRELRETQEQDKFNKAEQKFKEELSKEERMKDQEKSEHSGLLGEISEGKTIDFQQVMMRKAHLEQLKVEIVENQWSSLLKFHPKAPNAQISPDLSCVLLCLIPP